jgi:hypothetical protein
MKKIYLSGPMTGLPHLNFPAFYAEADRLRALGYDVVNPAELNPDTGKSWQECMRVDIREMMDCDTVAVMPGWAASSGAHLEIHIASRVGIRVVEIGLINEPMQVAA